MASVADDPLVLDALRAMLAIEVAQMHKAASTKIRCSELTAMLGDDKATGDAAVEALRSLGYARKVLFGCVELTRDGRLAAMRAAGAVNLRTR